jgi:hypothetical protein
LFDQQVFAIVTGYLPRALAIGYLQLAAITLPDTEKESFVQYGLSRLERLT